MSARKLDLTPEERKARRAETIRKYLANRSPEQKAKVLARQRVSRANLSPEDKAKLAESKRDYLANIPQEQKDKYKEKEPEYRKKYLNKLSIEKKLKRIEYHKNRNASFSEDKKAEIKDKERLRRANLSSEEKEAKLAKRRLDYENLPLEVKEKYSEKEREYKKLKPHIRLRAKAKRRNQKALNVSKEDNKITETLIRKWRSNKVNWCNYCCCELTKGKFHIDHVLPLAKGGLHRFDNLCVSCAVCNRRKSSKVIGLDWFPPNWKFSRNWSNNFIS